MLCGRYLQQTEHGVAYVEAMPPVVVGDGTVTLPHGVHPSGQRLRGEGGYDSESKARKKVLCYNVIILGGFQVSHGHDSV